MGYEQFTVAIWVVENVGKAFSIVCSSSQAIVDNVLSQRATSNIAEWNGKTFNVIDTGGSCRKAGIYSG